MHPLCNRCGAAAEVVHHIKGAREHEHLRFDADNFEALCSPCHNKETGNEIQERRSSLDLPIKPFTCKVTAIVGPPCAGKLAIVRNSAGSSDLIVDLDALGAALSATAQYGLSTRLLPFVLKVRSHIFQLLTEPNDIPRAWLTLGAPLRNQRQDLREHGAEVVLLIPPQDECYSRALSDPMRSGNADGWVEHIDKWFATYEPD